VSRRSQLWIALGLLVFAGGYFVLDVRQRARTDRGVKRHRTDFTVYQYAARALRLGEDPYEATNPRGYRYVYPPLLAITLMPIAAWDPPDAALVFYALSAAALVYAFLRLLRFRPERSGPALGWPALLLASLTCLGFVHQGFQRGQVTLILLALHVAALGALQGRHFARAGLLLALGGALRLTPLLAAGAVGLGLLAAARGAGWRPCLRFSGGVAAGLVLGFVLVPLVALGPSRARAVSERWLEATQAVYAENEDLGATYQINEWRFKNQAPRRVYGTWMGWVQGVPFEKERPRLDEAGLALLDALTLTTTGLFFLLACGLGVCFLRVPEGPSYAAAYAAVTLLPVLMTRYTWPTHYVLALPAVALAAAPLWPGGVMRRTRWVLLLGALLFYSAHAAALQGIGEAGCLLLACVLFLVAFLRVALPGGGAREAGA
jgi:hypothetical protein